MILKEYERQMFEKMSHIDLLIRKNMGVTFTPLSTVKKMFSILFKDDIDFKNIKILEPSCGKGIFILYLIDLALKKENYTDENIIIFISNIYAMDINEEFIIELRKDIFDLILSIKNDFLLIDELKKILNENIICKNFLSFKFNLRFDYIIGNPPYVRIHNLDENTKKIIKSKEFEEVFSGFADLSIFFIYKSFKILNESKNSKVLFITSNKFITARYGFKLRKFIYKNLFYYSQKYNNPFSDVNINTSIIGISINDNKEIILEDKIIKKENYFNGEEWNFYNFFTQNKNGLSLKELGISISNGIVSGFNKAHIINKDQYEYFINKDINLKKIIKPIINGKNLENNDFNSNEYIIYAIPKNNEIISTSAVLIEHFNKYKKELKNRSWFKNKKDTQEPFYYIQGNSQFHIDEEYLYLTKRIGELSFIKVPNTFLYMDTVYNLIYPKNIDIHKLIEIIDKNKEYFYSISNQIGNKFEIHKNKFERIILNEEEIKYIQKNII